MARPRTQHVKTVIEIGLSPTLLEYIDALVKLEGFGDSRPEVIRNFVWLEVNRLIAAGRFE